MKTDPKLITGLQNISYNYSHTDPREVDGARTTLGWAIARLQEQDKEIKDLDELNAIYQSALHEIMKPVEALRNRTPQGHVFDGDMAFRLARDPNYLMRIAQKALALEQEQGS